MVVINDSNINNNHLFSLLIIYILLSNSHTSRLYPTTGLKYSSARCFGAEETQYNRKRSSEDLLFPGVGKTLARTLYCYSSNIFGQMATICISRSEKQNPPTVGLLARKEEQRASQFIRCNYCLLSARNKRNQRMGWREYM